MNTFISTFGLCREICLRNLMILAVILFVVVIVVLGIFLQRTIYGLAAPQDGSADTETSNIARLIAIAFTLGTGLMGALLIFDFYAHSATNGKEGTEATASAASLAKVGGFLGTFGDFFGGVVNPLLTFGTLIALAVTILLQRVQLRDARAEAGKSQHDAYIQAFETTFFHLLNLHAENVKNLVFDRAVIDNKPDLVRLRRLAGLQPPSPSKVITGREVFAEVLRSTDPTEQNGVSQLDLYRWLQKEHNHILGHYFRHLYQILNLIDKLKVNVNRAERDRIRKRYSNLVRAQLSSHELAVLFLNCTFNTVDEGRFRDLLIWYKFLEHLPVSMDTAGQLCIPGIAPGEQWIFFEYFDAKPGTRFWLSGAYGKNPVIKRFLAAQESHWTGPVPWHPKSQDDARTQHSASASATPVEV